MHTCIAAPFASVCASHARSNKEVLRNFCVLPKKIVDMLMSYLFWTGGLGYNEGDESFLMPHKLGVGTFDCAKPGHVNQLGRPTICLRVGSVFADSCTIVAANTYPK